MAARFVSRWLSIAVLVLVAVLGACSDSDPAAAPSPTPSPLPTEPVLGAREVEIESLSSDAVLSRGEARPPDDEAVEALAAFVTAWLDDHLDDLQRGGQGSLRPITHPELWAEVDAQLAAGASIGLADPEHPVTAARYHLMVTHDGAPQWVRAVARVTRHDGSIRTATFVFVPTEASPVLIALEAEPVAVPPAPAPTTTPTPQESP